MSMLANQRWEMRASKEDKAIIRRVAQHYRCKQSQIVKEVFRVLYKNIQAKENNQAASA